MPGLRGRQGRFRAGRVEGTQAAAENRRRCGSRFHVRNAYTRRLGRKLVQDMEKYLESPLFAGITEAEAERMLNCAKAVCREYSAGSIIFGEDDRPKNLYLLLEGKVQIVKNLPSGKRNLLFQVSEREVFGNTCASESTGCYWYEAVAVKPSRVLILPVHFIYGFCPNVCAHHKMIIRNLLDIQAGNNLQMTKKLHIVTNTTLRQKIALWILEVGAGGDKAVMDMNREELADYLGVTRPSLSRTLMEMQREGLIRIEGRTVWIRDAEKLGKMMEDGR